VKLVASRVHAADFLIFDVFFMLVDISFAVFSYYPH